MYSIMVFLVYTCIQHFYLHVMIISKHGDLFFFFLQCKRPEMAMFNEVSGSISTDARSKIIFDTSVFTCTLNLVATFTH